MVSVCVLFRGGGVVSARKKKKWVSFVALMKFPPLDHALHVTTASDGPGGSRPPPPGLTIVPHPPSPLVHIHVSVCSTSF